MRRKIRNALVCNLIAGIILVVYLAAPAHADYTFSPHGYKGDQNVGNYVQDLLGAGATNNNPSIADKLGADVCQDLVSGWSEARTINYFITQANVTRNQSKIIVWGAEWHFCLEYY